MTTMASASEIQDKLDQASLLLEEARKMSFGTNYHFYFEDLGYGAGAELHNGVWIPSSSNWNASWF